MYCIVDTKDHVLNELLDDIDFDISFNLGEFVQKDSPWIVATPLLASADEEKFVKMMCEFDELMAERLGDEWEDGKRILELIPFDQIDDGSGE